jgi:hypothetical protein
VWWLRLPAWYHAEHNMLRSSKLGSGTQWKYLALPLDGLGGSCTPPLPRLSRDGARGEETTENPSIPVYNNDLFTMKQAVVRVEW